VRNVIVVFKFLCRQERHRYRDKYLSQRKDQRSETKLLKREDTHRWSKSQRSEQVHDLYRERTRIVCMSCLDYRKTVFSLTKMPMTSKEKKWCCVGCLLFPLACLGCPCIATAQALKKQRQGEAWKAKRPQDPIPEEFVAGCKCCILPCGMTSSSPPPTSSSSNQMS